MSLTLSHIHKSYGGKKVVDDLSFTMDQPGIFGLIGTNGAGKTTTIRMILKVADPDSGVVTWNGAPMERHRVKIGYMPEERGIYPKLSVLRQLVYFGQLNGMTRAQAVTAADYWLARVGMTEYRKFDSEKLSKGNQQKIQLLLTVMHDPELIFLDEPFSGLDPINTEIFKSILAELRSAGKFIVLSSHQMTTVEEYCRSLVLLDHGKTLLSGNLQEIKDGYGHTNLVLRAAGDILPLARTAGVRLLTQAEDEYEFKINDAESAHTLLNLMLARGIFPIKFEIRQPSLHEIFIDKVGERS